MNILYFLFFIPFSILFSFQPAVGETRHNLELNLKKTNLDTKQVSLTKDKTYFLTSSIINQNQVIQNNNKADVFLNKAFEDFKKADKYLSKAKKDYEKGQKSLKKANLFYKRGDSSLALIRVESKRANKILDESYNDYKKGLVYLSEALETYQLYLKEIKPKLLIQP